MSFFFSNEPAHHSLLAEYCFGFMKSGKSGFAIHLGNIMSSFLVVQ